MHVRLSCTDGDSLCKNQLPPTSGTGCDELNRWREQVLRPAKPRKKVLDNSQPAVTQLKAVKRKPEQCAALLQ